MQVEINIDRKTVELKTLKPGDCFVYPDWQDRVYIICDTKPILEFNNPNFIWSVGTNDYSLGYFSNNVQVIPVDSKLTVWAKI